MPLLHEDNYFSLPLNGSMMNHFGSVQDEIDNSLPLDMIINEGSLSSYKNTNNINSPSKQSSTFLYNTSCSPLDEPKPTFEMDNTYVNNNNNNNTNNNNNNTENNNNNNIIENSSTVFHDNENTFNLFNTHNEDDLTFDLEQSDESVPNTPSAVRLKNHSSNGSLRVCKTKLDTKCNPIFNKTFYCKECNNPDKPMKYLYINLQEILYSCCSENCNFPLNSTEINQYIFQTPQYPQYQPNKRKSPKLSLSN
ncbi:hypothetical protein DLAC_02657 [Tieghemostelium lacteum]|uniref:Uncharacterized protein n=1 Tax=Tieghemostelium lacteum TaxID=361077 RepID=A0A152A345_TIELA|nr:hypothetical protein DLAC_02657 [Tieghemostelium lacteum]|eukprot:KYR00629.1 hypothetical protein DLAC_02657 [Tieghemostelium lacteum]